MHANTAQFWKVAEQVDDLLSGTLGASFKASPGSFSRDGALSPALIVTLLLRMVSTESHLGYRHLLDELWQEASEQGVPLPQSEPVSAAAFCKARRRLKPELFRELLYALGDQTDHALGDQESKWKGKRVFAVDGTTRTVRRSPELREHFGSAEGSFYPQASVSALSDVLTGVTYDLWIGPYGCDEREVLLQLLPQMHCGDLLILDRGYPGYEVIEALTKRGIDFVIRMPKSTSWPQFGQFVESGADEAHFTLPLKSQPPGPGQLCPLLRAVRRPRPNGESMFLLTSLSSQTASACELEELYQRRWAIEETYKLAKGDYLNQRQMHAKTVEGVEQEIWALDLFISLARTMRRLAAAQVDEDPRDLSQKAAMRSTGRALVSLILAQASNPDAWLKAVEATLARIAKNLDRRRPGRHHSRRSLQPRQRWGSTGRVGLAKEVG